MSSGPNWEGAQFDLSQPGVLSRLLRRARAAQAVQHVKGRVLDYGCGRGYFSKFVNTHDYIGVDVNPRILKFARHLNPAHTFMEIRDLDMHERFDTIVSLAVIEHVEDPIDFMNVLAARMNPGGRIVITTPEPWFEQLYERGASLHLFSRNAADEHESLLSRRRLSALADASGLRMATYRRFLGGANQLAVYERLA